MPERYRISEKKNNRADSQSGNSDNNNNNNDNRDGEDNDDDGDSPSIPHPRAERTDSGNVNAFHDRHLAPGGDESYGRAPSSDSEATLVVEESILMRQGAQGMSPEKMREMMQDPNIVTWYGMDDQENPINW